MRASGRPKGTPATGDELESGAEAPLFRLARPHGGGAPEVVQNVDAAPESAFNHL